MEEVRTSHVPNGRDMYRKLATAAVVTGIISGPYIASETQIGRNVTGSVRNVLSTSSDVGAVAGSARENSHHATETLWDQRLDPRDLERFAETDLRNLVGGPVHDFRDVLRFDITPEWVTSRYSRVTTVLSDLQLEGLRVPLVTGTSTDDIAGSITYYFRHDGRLQRVALHGFTGDASRLVNMMTEHYGMRNRPTLDSGVYTIDWNGHPTSVLKISRAPVMYADAIRHQQTVFLELNQPHVDYGLSPEAKRIVSADWSTGRW